MGVASGVIDKVEEAFSKTMARPNVVSLLDRSVERV